MDPLRLVPIKTKNKAHTHLGRSINTSWETRSLILTKGIIMGSGQAEEQMHW